MAPSGSGGRGGLGWVILAAALAVPGFLFYNWWSHLKAEHDRGVTAKARSRVEGGVFQASPAAGRLTNPMAPSTAPAAGLSSAAAAVPAPKSAAAPALPAAKAAAAAPAAPAPASVAPAPAVSSAAAPGSVAMSSAATVVLARDPMLSPMDLVRIQEAEIEAQARAQALLDEENRRHQPHRAPRPPKKKPIETRIELQGIVAKPDGDNLAIINGATVNPGERFTVEGYPGKVIIRKISTTDVTLEYEGRKIVLSVNAE